MPSPNTHGQKVPFLLAFASRSAYHGPDSQPYITLVALVVSWFEPTLVHYQVIWTEPTITLRRCNKEDSQKGDLQRGTIENGKNYGTVKVLYVNEFSEESVAKKQQKKEKRSWLSAMLTDYYGT